MTGQRYNAPRFGRIPRRLRKVKNKITGQCGRVVRVERGSWFMLWDDAIPIEGRDGAHIPIHPYCPTYLERV